MTAHVIIEVQIHFQNEAEMDPNITDVVNTVVSATVAAVVMHLKSIKDKRVRASKTKIDKVDITDQAACNQEVLTSLGRIEENQKLLYRNVGALQSQCQDHGERLMAIERFQRKAITP